MRSREELVEAIIESLEPLPSMPIREAERAAWEAANPGHMVGVALAAEGQVHVREGCGQQFWDALQDLYEQAHP